MKKSTKTKIKRAAHTTARHGSMIAGGLIAHKHSPGSGVGKLAGTYIGVKAGEAAFQGARAGVQHVNQRNAKTGIRASTHAPVRPGSRQPRKSAKRI